MFSTTFRAFLVLAGAVVLLLLLVIAATTMLVRFGGLWLPMGHTLSGATILGILAVMAQAVRRDLALADLRTAFGRYLPAPVVEASLDPQKRAFSGEERTITVLMADLSGFTAFCGAHRERPSTIIAALSRKFTSAQDVIDRFEGCLDKYDGDAALAMWNAIGAQPDHAARAVAAGLAIIEAQNKANAEALMAGAEPDPLSFKVSIATGVAFVGSYGSRQKMNFSAIGEPMNLAARLEKVCADYGVQLVLAESTYRAMKEATTIAPDVAAMLAQYEFLRLGESEVKGFTGSVVVYGARKRDTAGAQPVSQDSHRLQIERL